MQFGRGFLAVLGILCFLSCQSTSNSLVGEKGPFYIGDGGKKLRFTVLQPTGTNLSSNEQWLLMYIQGTLTNCFKTYSAMTVLDRQNLDKILENQNISASGNFSDDDFVSIGNLTNARYILIGNIKKTEYTNFVIDFSISDAATGEIKAAFSPTICSYTDLQNLSVINKAAEELLLKMGVELTDLGKKNLYNNRMSNIGAEIALSKGIEAQRNGNMGQALSYYYNAISFDPSLKEAKSRASIVSTNVSTGNIGENARNAIAYRNAWKKTLDECDAFFADHFPFEIIYNAKISQSGKVNYYKESIDLEMDIQVKPTELFNLITDIQKGINKTGRKNEWGFQRWPFEKLTVSMENLLDNPENIMELSNAYPGTNQKASSFEPVDKAIERGADESFWGLYSIVSTSIIPYGKKMIVDIALINDIGETISAVSVNIFGQAGTLTNEHRNYHGWYDYDSSASIKPVTKKFTVGFTGVDVNKITENTTVKILSINGKDANSLGMDGYIKITAKK